MCFFEDLWQRKSKDYQKKSKEIKDFSSSFKFDGLQKKQSPYYNFFHISIEFTLYDVGLGKHLSSTGAHYLNISIKLWDTIWLSYTNALWAKIFSKIGSYQTWHAPSKGLKCHILASYQMWFCQNLLKIAKEIVK